MNRLRWLLAGIILALLFPTLGRAADAGVDPGAQRATDFTAAIVAGQDDAARQFCDATLKGALSSEALVQMRAGLVAQQGAIKGSGTAWQEDVVQSYRRYRVPVTFEKGVLDFRVVLDKDNVAVGIFVVEHVDRPAAGAAAPALPDGVREIEMTIGPAETSLPGTLTIPKGTGPFPAVVLVHGSGPHDRDETVLGNKPFRDIAYGLAQRRIAVLRYDKRTHARPKDLTALDPKTLTVKQETIDDAVLAVEALRARSEIDGKRLYVAGHSLGGQVAPRIARAITPPLAGLIVLAGSTSPLPEKVLEQTQWMAKLDGSVSPEEQKNLDALSAQVTAFRAAMKDPNNTTAGFLGAPIQYYRDLEAHDPPQEAAQLGLPIFVAQGERDYHVTMDDFGRWKKALQGKKGVCLKSYTDLDHLLRAGKGPSGPADYQRAAPVEPKLIADIEKFIKGGGC